MIAALGTVVVPVSSFGADTAEAAPLAAQCAAGGPDFNGDQCGDLVVADPDATVAGKLRAGRINVLYGGEGGLGAGGKALLAQGQPGVGDSPETDDRFGTIVHTANINNDSYTDLVVGVPSESVGSADDAGVIHVIFGSANGLGGGRAGTVLRQGVSGIPGGPEAGDRFGAAVAVNTTSVADGAAPAVAYGVPGEDVGSVADAGAAGLVTFNAATGGVTAAARITQDSPGISGAPEAGDRFGAAVELFQGPGGFGCGVTGIQGFTLVVGVPGEDLPGGSDAGLVHLARDLTTDTPMSQNTDGVDGAEEAGDQFGASLALSSECEHDGPSHVKLAVGVPNEDIDGAADAGLVHLFATDNDELPLPQRWSVNQNSAGVDGAAESGDRFGSVLALGGPWRDGFGEPLIVGVLGEDLETATDAGGVQVFGDAASAPGNGDVFLSQSNVGEVPQAADHFGAALSSRYDYLLVGAPDDVTYSKGAVHGIAWPAVFGTPSPHQLFVPGKDGVPADAVRFGAGLS